MPAGDMTIRAATTSVISFSGDSVTAGWLDSGVPPNPNPSQRWQAGLESFITSRFGALGRAAPTYFNNGVGGQTTTQMLAAVATVIAQAPQHIFVLSSVNDPANSISPLSTTPNTFNNYEQWAQSIWSALPTCKIHVVSNLFSGGVTNTSELVPDSSNPLAASTIAMNSILQQWAALHRDRAEYLDIRADFLAWEIANNGGNAPNGLLTQSSGTHLSATGQALASTGVINRIVVA